MQMEKIRVAVADDDASFVQSLSSKLLEEEVFELVGVADNGEDICRIIRERSPDVVSLDMIMPRMDGLSVLDQVKRELRFDQRPNFLMVSGIRNDHLADEALSLGADYYLCKPVAPALVMEKMKKMFRDSGRYRGSYFRTPGEFGGYGRGTSQGFTLKAAGPVPEEEKTLHVQEKPVVYYTGNRENDVTTVLHELEIPTQNKGFQYLRDAILCVMDEPELLRKVTRELYPLVASRNQSSPARVERAIRHVIEVGWNRGKTDTMERVFGFPPGYRRSRPTNSEFIALVVDKLSLEYKIALSNL